ncbi:hypothetical protein COV15_03215 [Candidatus Woesearchaeota archaeon CG10_big_fil_rev_8_21_14_0_10_34_12]|nr:MAG: hypothetical protein COV15_03215 [Candidatus Woesearchaeota archaeon CG10_big_fil_rev_8_21_14_0_10_34_12]
MSFESLLNEKKIERVEKREFIADSAERSIEFAKTGIETGNYDEVMSIAYNAVFRLGTQLMNFMGFRAVGQEHHKNMFEFLIQARLDDDLVYFFDNIRKKRNDFIYRNIEAISKEEAEDILDRAEYFVQKIRTFVQKIRTGVKNAKIKK